MKKKYSIAIVLVICLLLLGASCQKETSETVDIPPTKTLSQEKIQPALEKSKTETGLDSYMHNGPEGFIGEFWSITSHPDSFHEYVIDVAKYNELNEWNSQQDMLTCNTSGDWIIDAEIGGKICCGGDICLFYPQEYWEVSTNSGPGNGSEEALRYLQVFWKNIE